MDDRLRRLQLCELEILKEFARVCGKHGLHYFLAGGTLLGAVRHQGFIPWDDDIDVAMPRKDYERFARLAPQELVPQFFYQSPDTDPHYFLTYNKIRKNGTAVYEERFKAAKFHEGVFIDIFPLDFCPKPGPVCHLLFNTLAVMNYRGQVDSGEVCAPYEEWSGKLGYAFLRLFSPRGLVKLRRRLLRLSARLSKRDWLASYAGAYGYRKEVFPWSWFQQTASISFEDAEYLAPEEYSCVLAQMFGEDYWKLPRGEQRKGHISLEGRFKL